MHRFIVDLFMQQVAICLAAIDYYSAAKAEPEKNQLVIMTPNKRQIAQKAQLNHRINQRLYLAFWGSSAKIASHF